MQAQIDALESAQPSDGKQAQAGQVMLPLYIFLAFSIDWKRLLGSCMKHSN